MAFVKKTWKDRIVQYANRRLLTKSGGGVEQVTVTRDEGTIYEEGDKFNASNMNDLEDRIEDALDYDKTASGSIVHITDGADNIPVKSLVSQIVATGGGGTPDAPIAISGFDSGVVPVCGKNLYNTNNQTKTAINTYCPMYLPSNSDITFSTNITQTGLYAQYYDNGNWVEIAHIYNSRILTFNTGDHNYIRLMTYNEGTQATEFQAEFGTTATTFEPFIGNIYTFTFGQTVYGGYFDNKGNLVVTHKILNFDYQSDWRYENLLGGNFYVACGSDVKASQFGDDLSCNCSPSSSILAVTSNTCLISVAKNFNFTWGGTLGITNVDDFKTYLQTNNLVIKVKCLLATPITLSITSQDIPTLLGENYIFSNCGNLEVDYYTDNADDILNFIHGELSSKADKTEDTTITVASGITLISSSCGKTDRLVHLNFNIEKSGGFATGWQVIGTTEFKPNTLVYCPLWNVTNGSANGEVRIDTDGTINFYVITAGELRLNANIGYVTS